MTTAKTSRKRTASSGTGKGSGGAAASRGRARTPAREPDTPPRETAPADAKARPETPADGDGQHSITLPVPSLDQVATGVANVALLPMAVARRVLPAKRGWPLYAGLGVLGVAEVIEWPVAVGIGVGYAALRRGGLLQPPASEKEQAA
ncbi:hypothetical protein [Streptomyces sp. B1866]|uniref:hypothetical protein n=1 Tax=Streptomyces sp. B1866 TaxID=3075431 RepID=UPI00289A5C6C|nr:hypothetical protein [Streptomyces sp. B1866]